MIENCVNNKLVKNKNYKLNVHDNVFLLLFRVIFIKEGCCKYV